MFLWWIVHKFVDSSVCLRIYKSWEIGFAHRFFFYVLTGFLSEFVDLLTSSGCASYLHMCFMVEWRLQGQELHLCNIMISLCSLTSLRDQVLWGSLVKDNRWWFMLYLCLNSLENVLESFWEMRPRFVFSIFLCLQAGSTPNRVTIISLQRVEHTYTTNSQFSL